MSRYNLQGSKHSFIVVVVAAVVVIVVVAKLVIKTRYFGLFLLKIAY